MNDEFGRASAGNGAGKEPVLRRELDALRAQEGRIAVPAPELTPRGTIRHIVRREEEIQRVTRATFIENRLAREQSHAVRDFRRAKIRGRAEHDFERSR